MGYFVALTPREELVLDVVENVVPDTALVTMCGV